MDKRYTVSVFDLGVIIQFVQVSRFLLLLMIQIKGNVSPGDY